MAGPLFSAAVTMQDRTGVGTAAARRNIRRVENQYQASNRAMRTGATASGAAFARLGGSASGALGSLTAMGASFGGVGIAASLAATAVVAFGIKSLTAAAAVQSFTVRQQNLIGVTRAQAEATTAAAQGLDHLGISFAAATEGAYAIQSAGLRDAEALKALEAAAKGSAIGLGTIGEVARATTASLTSWGAAGETAVSVLDKILAAAQYGTAGASEYANQIGQIGPLAAELGVSLDASLGTIAALTKGNNSAALSTTQLRGVFVQLLRPAQSATKVLGDMGMSIESVRASIADDFIGGLINLRRQLEANGHELKDVFSDTEGLQAVLAITGDRANDFAAAVDHVTNSEGKLDEAVVRTSETLQHQWKMAKAQMGTAFAELGESLIPVATQALQAFNAVIRAGVGIVRAYNEVQDGLVAGFHFITGGHFEAEKAVASFNGEAERARRVLHASTLALKALNDERDASVGAAERAKNASYAHVLRLIDEAEASRAAARDLRLLNEQRTSSARHDMAMNRSLRSGQGLSIGMLEGFQSDPRTGADYSYRAGRRAEQEAEEEEPEKAKKAKVSERQQFMDSLVGEAESQRNLTENLPSYDAALGEMSGQAESLALQAAALGLGFDDLTEAEQRALIAIDERADADAYAASETVLFRQSIFEAAEQQRNLTENLPSYDAALGEMSGQAESLALQAAALGLGFDDLTEAEQRALIAIDERADADRKAAAAAEAVAAAFSKMGGISEGYKFSPSGAVTGRFSRSEEILRTIESSRTKYGGAEHDVTRLEGKLAAGRHKPGQKFKSGEFAGQTLTEALKFSRDRVQAKAVYEFVAEEERRQSAKEAAAEAKRRAAAAKRKAEEDVRKAEAARARADRIMGNRYERGDITADQRLSGLRSQQSAAASKYGKFSPEEHAIFTEIQRILTQIEENTADLDRFIEDLLGQSVTSATAPFDRSFQTRLGTETVSHEMLRELRATLHG